MNEFNNEYPEFISQRAWNDNLIQMRNRILERAPSLAEMPIKEQEAIVIMIIRFENEVKDIAVKARKIQDTQFALMEQLLDFRNKNLSGLNESFCENNGATQIRESILKDKFKNTACSNTVFCLFLLFFRNRKNCSLCQLHFQSTTRSSKSF